MHIDGEGVFNPYFENIPIRTTKLGWKKYRVNCEGAINPYLTIFPALEQPKKDRNKTELIVM